ncbi:unnamed protein product, partial [Laminaria digitata]
LDFDLHHGNGSQDLLWNEKDILFASSHEIENWPQSGHKNEVGTYGQVCNEPLHSGSGGIEARAAWQNIFDRVAEFSPDIILVSAGFDAHGNDPLSGLNWCLEDYEWIGSRIGSLANEICDGRVLTILEGGYDLQVLRAGTYRYLAGLMGIKAPCPDVYLDVQLNGLGSPYFKGHESDRGTGRGFEVLKRHQRMWICDTMDGSLLYSSPSFQALNARTPLQLVCDAANLNGELTISQIIDMEAAQVRRFGYNPGRLRGDFK